MLISPAEISRWCDFADFGNRFRFLYMNHLIHWNQPETDFTIDALWQSLNHNDDVPSKNARRRKRQEKFVYRADNRDDNLNRINSTDVNMLDVITSRSQCSKTVEYCRFVAWSQWNLKRGLENCCIYLCVQDQQLCWWRQSVCFHVTVSVCLHTELDHSHSWHHAFILHATLCYMWQGKRSSRVDMVPAASVWRLLSKLVVKPRLRFDHCNLTLWR